MGEWFTVDKIETDTFAISEYLHWEETHCYLLLETKCALLIDTGLGVSNIQDVVRTLTKLPIVVATTHVHWDHIGGHKYFNDLAVHELEKNWLDSGFPIPLEIVKHNLTCKPCAFPSDFNLNDYQIFQGTPQRILHDHDCIDIGNRQISVIHTPGHSPGHCCFYEPQRKHLYSGDLIYKGCLDAFYPTTDPVLFWQSVKKVQLLDIEQILPAHHGLELSVNIIGRIEQAFRKLSDENDLKHGSGVFDFHDFQIHI